MTATASSASHVDAARVRSFVGLVVARLGPRAYGVVSGTFLALLVASHTRSLFAVTFALTAHRLVSWVSYPLLGRWSDGSHSRIGRRLPYMAAGLAVMGACTFFYPDAGSYWALVALLVVARQARVAYSLPNIAVTPEVFGRSRWIRALIAVGIGGLVVGISVRLTVLATWKRGDPTTWAPAFRLAAAFMILGAIALVVLVREAPAARALEPDPRLPWREQLRELLSTPNARVLAATALLGLAASGTTDRVYPVYAEHVLGASGGDLAVSGFVAGPLSLLFGVPIGLLLASRLSRRTIAWAAPLGGALGAFAHLFVTTLWQSVLIGVLATPLLVAVLVSIGPFVASLVPRSGGMTERIGVLVGPSALVGVAASYLSALTYDHVVHDYRVIWAFAAVFTGLIAVPLVRLRVPVGHERADVRAMLREGMEVTRARLRERTSLFGGEVTAHDADTTDFVDSLRALAARYGFDDGDPDGPAPTGTVP